MAEQELVGQELDEHIHAQQTLRDFQNLVRDTQYCYHRTITEYYGTYSSVNDLICDLSGCKCCERHQTKRPIKFEQYIDPPIPPSVIPVQKLDHELDCKYRMSFDNPYDLPFT